MERKGCPKGIRPRNLQWICYVLLSTLVVLTLGCGGTRQHISVTSEHLPSDEKPTQAVEKPEKGIPAEAVKETPLDSISKDTITEEQLAVEQRPDQRLAEEQRPEAQVPEGPLPEVQLPEGEEFEGQLAEPRRREEEVGLLPPRIEGPSIQAEEPPIDELDLESSQIAKVAPIPLMEPPEDLAQLPRTLTDVFFDYDQFRIRQDAITALETNAKVLIWRYPDRRVVIEGHCDERGTEEYNLILGERRAVAVKNYLMDLGVPEENLQVISYGKEKPFCLEHSRGCWQQNRRGHFVIH